MFIEDELTAYCLDEAVGAFGSHVEYKLDKASEKAKTPKVAEAKREAALKKLLGEKKRFADPANFVRK